MSVDPTVREGVSGESPSGQGEWRTVVTSLFRTRGVPYLSEDPTVSTTPGTGTLPIPGLNRDPLRHSSSDPGREPDIRVPLGLGVVVGGPGPDSLFQTPSSESGTTSRTQTNPPSDRR